MAAAAAEELQLLRRTQALAGQVGLQLAKRTFPLACYCAAHARAWRVALWNSCTCGKCAHLHVTYAVTCFICGRGLHLRCRAVRPDPKCNPGAAGAQVAALAKELQQRLERERPGGAGIREGGGSGMELPALGGEGADAKVRARAYTRARAMGVELEAEPWSGARLRREGASAGAAEEGPPIDTSTVEG